jgi:hypothetical protein
MTTKTLTTEAEFLAAEKEIPLLQAVRDGLPKGSLGSAENNAVEALSDKIGDLSRAIDTSAPPTIAAAMVKLRHLADPDWGVDPGPDLDCLRQILAFFERNKEASDDKPSDTAAASLPFDSVQANLESDLAHIKDIAAALAHFDVGEDRDRRRALRYLADLLDERHEQAEDAYCQLFGLNNYSVQRGGPGPLVVEAPPAGGAA